MRLLLDTHLVLAVVNAVPQKSSTQLDRIISDPRHSFIVSVASLWEIAIKFRLGKLPLRIELEDIAAQLEEGGIDVLPIAPEHAVAEALPTPRTRDPFDRLLLAIAQVEQARLLTMDSALTDHPLAWPSDSD